MSTQSITPVQIQMAASAGLELLNIKDLPVPMSIAKSGALSVLEGMLGAVARGELVLTPPVVEKPPGDGESATPPALESIAGGKKESDEAK